MIGRLGRHDLLHQPAKRGDASGGLAAAENLAPVDVPGGQIGQRATPVVFVFHAHQPGFPGWQGGVATAAGLDGGLLVRAQHVIARAQRGVSQTRAYRSSTTAALPAKSGARGAIQDRYCQGLIASVASQRATVDAEMSTTIPASIARRPARSSTTVTAASPGWPAVRRRSR